MSSPIAISRTPRTSQLDDTLYHEILRRMDNILSLGATQDAIESIACSAFFDPSIPCNLVGSASLGIEKSCLPDSDPNQQRLLNAISSKAPEVSPFWISLVMNDQALPLLQMALKQLPPINLVAAFWTNTLQSFLQVTYHQNQTHAQSAILRAREFQTSFYCRAEAWVPWAPSPPFGITGSDNLSLDVRAHDSHEHRPLSWATLWRLRSGDTIPMGITRQLSSEPVSIMQYPEPVDF
ncbi:hypothetical protein N7456_000031 [Penicillium angulare]|uniref:Uncharacterized protein n=1 Tax=Penicillium angulare TaxID=116970 RepID=A0A9W9KRI1_9EURO|nr:hypothetical protein N7456_000031 [Penicillium angulare]